MKRKIITARGVRVCAIELTARSDHEAINGVIERAEDAFYFAAVSYGERRAEKIGKMTAPQRRGVKCDRIYMKSDERRLGKFIAVKLTFSLVSDGGEHTEIKTLWYDEAADLFVLRRGKKTK